MNYVHWWLANFRVQGLSHVERRLESFFSSTLWDIHYYTHVSGVRHPSARFVFSKIYYGLRKNRAFSWPTLREYVLYWWSLKYNLIMISKLTFNTANVVCGALTLYFRNCLLLGIMVGFVWFVPGKRWMYNPPLWIFSIRRPIERSSKYFAFSVVNQDFAVDYFSSLWF